MYTQCPDCGTVFKITADALRAAQGTVRCGICSTGFSALEYLSEQPLLQPHEAEEAPEDTMTVEELPGTEFIELSSAQDPPTEATRPPDEGDEPRQLPDADDTDAGDEHPTAAEADADVDDDVEVEAEFESDFDLEFHGSAEDLDRLFVEDDVEAAGRGAASVEDLDKSIGEIAAADLSGIEVVEESPPADDDGTGDGAHPGRIAAVLAFRRPDGGDTDDGTQAGPAAFEAATAAEQDIDLSDPLSRTDEYPILALEEGDDAGAALHILIPEELRHAAAGHAPAADAFAAGDAPEESRDRRWPLIVGLVVALLVLAAQAVHFWREDLVRHPLAGPWLLRAYAAAGVGLDAPVDLLALEIRQLGAANDPIQAGRLKVRASIVNHAPFAQPYPLLRLSLQDRFGTTVGVRNLEPAEYLPGGSAGALLAPSRRADAEIVFVDPGRDAVGYELDVCLRDSGGVHCSAELNGRRQ